MSRNRNGRAADTGATKNENTATTRRNQPTDRVEMCGGCLSVGQLPNGKIIITLSGRIADNLHRVAATTNRVPWCDNDNTAATVVAYFCVGDILARWDEKKPLGEIRYFAECVDTGADGDEQKARTAELYNALCGAFNAEQKGVAK